MKRDLIFQTDGIWKDGQVLVVCHNGTDLCLKDLPKQRVYKEIHGVYPNPPEGVVSRGQYAGDVLAFCMSLLAFIVAFLAFFRTHRLDRRH